MPIFEYGCRDCGLTFEAYVVRHSDEAEVTCPACASPQVEKRISAPAATPAAGGSPGGRCGPASGG